MSTATLAAPLPRGGAATTPGLARLTAVELRKMTDTRAGFWLQLLVAGLTVLVVVLVCIFGEVPDRRFQELIVIALQPVTILLPIIGILLVTSEWTQRTAMVTFSLVPHRSRVMAAKLLASVVVALIAMALSVAVAALGAAFAAPSTSGAWSLSGAVFGQMTFYVVTAMLGGVAVGALFLASAPAIVFYFVAPLTWAIAGSFSFLEGAARWLDGTRTMEPLFEQALSGTEWARVGTTLALWLLLPLLIGLWRIARGEVR
jgi:ABC-2 type transport system permease protein